MKKYCFHLILFFLIQFGIGFVITRQTQPHKDNYIYAIKQKNEFALATKGPRVFFVGGSNLAFGLDCEQIASEFPRVTPVNLGLHAALGLPFMLNSATPLVREGDQVILCLEYEHYNTLSLFDVLPRLLLSEPTLTQYIDWETTKALLDKEFHFLHYRTDMFVRFVKHGIISCPKPQPPYNLASFDKYGDVVAHWDMPLPTQNRRRLIINPHSIVYTPKYMEKTISRINQFSRDMEKRGVRVFLTFPPIPIKRYQKSEKILAKINQKLHDNLCTEILGTPEDFVFSGDSFYDTVYHLTGTGVHKRTKKLIDVFSKNATLYYALTGHSIPSEEISRIPDKRNKLSHAVPGNTPRAITQYSPK